MQTEDYSVSGVAQQKAIPSYSESKIMVNRLNCFYKQECMDEPEKTLRKFLWFGAKIVAKNVTEKPIEFCTQNAQLLHQSSSYMSYCKIVDVAQ